MGTRLDKFICHATGYSRQQVQRLVRSGGVSVNHCVIKRPEQKIAESDIILLAGEVISPPLPRYIMLNKPAGYICANRDGNHPVVLDLLGDENKSALQIAGRLDLDTTGLVLITDDGSWNHSITSPSNLCRKTYRVFLSDPLSIDAAEQLRAGIFLTGEKKITQPAEVIFLDNSGANILLTICEGRYHQVKRMLAAVGNHVITLHRESIGGINLDPLLAPGKYRPLTQSEILSVV